MDRRIFDHEVFIMKFLRVSPRAEPLLNISTRPIKLFRVINSRVVGRDAYRNVVPLRYGRGKGGIIGY